MCEHRERNWERNDEEISLIDVENESVHNIELYTVIPNLWT